MDVYLVACLGRSPALVSPRRVLWMGRRALVMHPSFSWSLRALARVAAVIWVYSIIREEIPMPASVMGLWMAAPGNPLGSLQHLLVMAAMAWSRSPMSASL